MMSARDRALLRQVRRRVRDALPFGPEIEPEPVPPPEVEIHFAEITSTSQTDGRYPGTLYLRNQTGTAATWEQLGDADAIWVDVLNSESLSTGTKYPVRITGTKTADGKPVFDVLVA